jgi:hypothetical protein
MILQDQIFFKEIVMKKGFMTVLMLIACTSLFAGGEQGTQPGGG